MFDIAWQELLVVGAVALIVVGPKELPTLLRTIGKYVGIVKRQAGEFRAQFDEAMKETELDQLKKDVEKIKADAESTFRDVERSVETEVSTMTRELDQTASSIDEAGSRADLHDANGVPMFPDEVAANQPMKPAGPGAAAIAAAAAAEAPAPVKAGG